MLLEPAPEPQNARKVLLELAPEPQNARKVPLELDPEPQNARNGRSSLPLNRRMLEKCCSSLACSRKMLEKCCSRLPRSRRMLEKCCSSLLRSHRMREKCRSSLPRSHSMRSKSAVFCSSAIGIFCSAPLCSVGLGLAGAFELAARALSASLRPRPGRAERKGTDPDKPSLPGDASHSGAADACCTPSPLGLAGALELAARPTWPRWGARPDRAERKRTEPDRPSLLGDASQVRTTDACCTQHRDEHTPCMECTGTH